MFAWPNGSKAALSLSFDDARPSQAINGLPLFDRHKARATFYVKPSNVHNQHDAWRRAVAAGHEIGNHTYSHPCSGNFPWARDRALEDFTLERIETDILQAQTAVQSDLGVSCRTFAYPCGQSFVGRGENHRSYVPVVARHFLAGRAFPGEAANDPAFCDLAHLTSRSFDNVEWDQVNEWIDGAMETGGWLILTGHDIGEKKFQSVSTDLLHALCEYSAKSSIWLDTVEAVATYLKGARTAP